MAYNEKMKTIIVAIMNNIYFKITLGEKKCFFSNLAPRKYDVDGLKSKY